MGKKQLTIFKLKNKYWEIILAISILLVASISVVFSGIGLSFINGEQLIIFIFIILLIPCILNKWINSLVFPTCIVLSFLLTLFSAHLAFKYNNTIGDGHFYPFEGISKLHFSYNVISILSFVLSIILFYKSNFANYIKKKSQVKTNNFIRKIANNNEYFIVAIIITILTPLFLSFLISDLLDEHIHKSFLGVSYTLAGVFVASLVYFKLAGKTTTLREYMDTFISILESSAKDDKIYIIGPTLFVGHEYSKGLHRRFEDILFEKIEQNVIFNIANLSIQENKLTEISDSYKSNFLKNIKNGFKKMNESTKVEREEYEKAKNILTEKGLLQTETKMKGLFDLHWEYFNFSNNKSQNEHKIAKHYHELISFYQKLLSMIKDSNKSKINKLHWNYYDKPYLNKSFVKGEDSQKSTIKSNSKFKSNFFAVANITQGIYYFGQYKIYDDRDQEFHGTVFENKLIGSQMNKLLDEFIKEYPDNLQVEIS